MEFYFKPAFKKPSQSSCFHFTNSPLRYLFFASLRILYISTVYHPHCAYTYLTSIHLNSNPSLPLPADASLAGLLETLLNVSLTGVILFRPLYDEKGLSIIDLAYERLNPAAQQMLKLPERPTQTFLTFFPTPSRRAYSPFTGIPSYQEKPVATR
jgi:hypothetical protein